MTEACSDSPLNITFNNAWNGRQCESWIDYMEAQAAETDVFCFQEMYSDKFRAQVRKLLPGFQEFTDDEPGEGRSSFFLATYVRPGITVRDVSRPLVDEATCGAALCVKLQRRDEPLHIVNMHGLALPEDDKLDTPARIRQSKILLDFFAAKSNVVIGGDFNLDRQTRSIGLFEERGYQNLIAEYNIQTTRNRFAWVYACRQLFADYVFASTDVQVKHFEVIDNEISDHLPMHLTVR